MASDGSSPRHQSSHQSIPLQDLSRPPDQASSDTGRGRTRSVSEKAKALLSKRQSFSGRINAPYERVNEGSPPAPDRIPRDLPRVTTPRSAHQLAPSYDEGEMSPVDVGSFQAAMGSVGLSFDRASPSNISLAASASPSTHSKLGAISETDDVFLFSSSIHNGPGDIDQDSYLSPTDDSTPLTDSRYLQPISGAQGSNSSGQRHDRQNSAFSFQDRSSPSSRLGDDLPNTEAGMYHSPNRALHRLSTQSMRSVNKSLALSVGSSPLSRAGSMVRKMSQRVVNLSNEPEVFEHTLRSQPSTRRARLEEPPSLPAMTEYAHDEPRGAPSIEKTFPMALNGQANDRVRNTQSLLKGDSLFIFSPHSWVRSQLCRMLVHPMTEPIILVLIFIQTILLAVDAAPTIKYNKRPKSWEGSKTDYAMVVLFSIYTLEILARIIVSGLIINSKEYSTIDWRLGPKKAIMEKIRGFFAPHRQQSTSAMLGPLSSTLAQPSILRSLTGIQGLADQPGNSRQQQTLRLARRAFLRHSFNRLDFLAVVSFWISFVLAHLSVEENSHMYVFRMLSCLRILRLLSLTTGTSVILRSLKKAAPLLVNVAFLIGFFWLLFAIIGVQIFKSSFRRTCVWYEDIENASPDQNMVMYAHNVAPNNIQFCGGHFDSLQQPLPWVKDDMKSNGTDKHKGYICPYQSLCVEGSNPYNGTVSFDNVLQSLQLVFVIMSSNTFTDLLYYTTDSDSLASALFFAFGFVIMSLWLINLLVAVITSSFQVIREESKTSAFTVDGQSHLSDDEETVERINPLKRLYNKTYWIWILIIGLNLIFQCLRSAKMSDRRKALIDDAEKIVTIILLIEICLRFTTDWRNFHKSRRNWVDFGLAVITAIIQIPLIHRSEQVYAWFTFFQIVRIYRVVLAVPLTKELIMRVLGNVTGLFNLIVFVFLLTFLTAIFAVQLFRGEFPSPDASGDPVQITFAGIFNSFIGMYQVLSSENWTVLMYNATQYELQRRAAWIGAAFFILWFILANFIVLNMFIAVIQENFDVTEDEKRIQQVRAFLQQKELGGSSHGNLSLSTIFKLGRMSGRRKDPLDYGPATTEMLLNDAVVRDFLDDQMEPLDDLPADASLVNDKNVGHVQPGPLSTIWGKCVGFFKNREPNPFYSRLQFSRAYEELDPRTMAREVVTATEQRRRAQRQYLQKHPAYNVSMFIFKPDNPVRKFCQRIVGPGRGSQRIEGVDPVKAIWYAFSAFIYAAIVAMVLLACISTPLYQRRYFIKRGWNETAKAPLTDTLKHWFVWTDMGFAALFTVEAMIKIIADGFFWTPNAYFRGSWGFIDGVVLVTLWINVVTALFKNGPVSKAVGAFKALRALRLLNVSDSARDTFHSVIVLGGWKVLSSAFVSLSLLIPFAVYGVNLFNDQMLSCNDQKSDIKKLADCVGEYNSTVYNWQVLAPRRVANPYYNFDNFGNSLFILFQIVSQEGWTDVMWSAMSANGREQQPQDNMRQGNAIFFLIFNLLGAVFVLTLFVSVFMRNYTEQTGVAFLTADQRSWLELRKLLRQISPSKRPSSQSKGWLRPWCYRTAVQKHGIWQRILTTILFGHLVLLVTETDGENEVWSKVRNYLFLVFTVFYIANIIIRIVGLTWKRFSRSSWDIYSILSVTGTVITTLLTLSRSEVSLYSQLHKSFLVSIALLLIPRSNQLDQLFKTAAASLTAIGNLLATWFVLFLVYAIALTQTFGLTKFGDNETGNLNFRDVPRALILLFRMSCGESWNAIMEDFATMTYPNCTRGDNFFESDCGSAGWARLLFISWNILSMYIFVSLFVSLIFESFSYVYQRSSGLSVVSREEIRRFKEAWATLDPDGTGFISKEAFPRLVCELSGIFDMRIYDGEHTVHQILDDCRSDSRGADPPPGVVHGIDLARLKDRLRTIDVAEIRRRRTKLDLFFHDIMVDANADTGVGFTSCLMILAHYNIIVDGKSLRLEEYLRRRVRQQRVQEEVRRGVVRGFLDMCCEARRFRLRYHSRESAIMTTVPQFGVPEIFIEDQDPESPQTTNFPPSSLSDYAPVESGRERMSLDVRGLRPRRGSNTGSPPQASRSRSGTVSTHRPSPSDSRASFQWGDGTVDASHGGARSRAGSTVSPHDVLQVFDHSAWGESIRRSSTVRRSGTRGRHAAAHDGR